MTISQALDAQFDKRIRQLERDLHDLEQRGAPDRSMARIRGKLEKARGWYNDKPRYERELPGALEDKVVSISESHIKLRNGCRSRVVRFKTPTAIYSFMPTTGKLAYLGPRHGERTAKPKDTDKAAFN